VSSQEVLEFAKKDHAKQRLLNLVLPGRGIWRRRLSGDLRLPLSCSALGHW